MGKISPVSIKYMIYAKFEAEGILDKPDIIGAIFGQTEGLLGNELEMRDLQKEGKIGRIEVELKAENGKTAGVIQIPSALDKTETTLIAAAIETVEKIGPSIAKIEIDKIEDVRENKRGYILERAKKMLEIMEEKMPKSKEISDNLKVMTREGKLREYGEEKLPCGNIDREEIIVVEGRADVINLLRNGVENAIGMNGTNLPKTIKELSYDKRIVLFIDGDRGGKLIARNVIDNARVDSIAFAPDGKEVEELTGKEILISLRRRIPTGEFIRNLRREDFGMRRDFRDRQETVADRLSREPEKKEENAESKKALDKEKLKKYLSEVENTKAVLILDSNLEIIKKVSSGRILSALDRISKPYIVVTDTATSVIVRAAEDGKMRAIAAKNFTAESTTVEMISL